MNDANAVSLSEFKSLKQEVEELWKKVQSLEISVPQTEATKSSSIDSDIDEDEIFPLKSVEDLRKLETALKENMGFRKKLVKKTCFNCTFHRKKLLYSKFDKIDTTLFQ